MKGKTHSLILILMTTTQAWAESPCVSKKEPWAAGIIRKNQQVWVSLSGASLDQAQEWRKSLAQKFKTSPESSSASIEIHGSSTEVRVDDLLPQWFIRKLDRKSPVETNCKATAYALSSLSPNAWSFESMFGINKESNVFQKQWSQNRRIQILNPEPQKIASGDLLYYQSDKKGFSDHMVIYLGNGLIAENNPGEAFQTFKVNLIDQCLERKNYGKPVEMIRPIHAVSMDHARDQFLKQLSEDQSATYHQAETKINTLFIDEQNPTPFSEPQKEQAQILYKDCKNRWLETKEGKQPYQEGQTEFLLQCFKMFQKLKSAKLF